MPLRALPDGTGYRPHETAGVGDGPEVLSRRERHIFGLLIVGYTNLEIARRLYLSVRTVESHRASVQEKLGVATRAELVELAFRSGLLRIELPPEA
jgi:two-component system, NarL family, response regulator NreC